MCCRPATAPKPYLIVLFGIHKCGQIEIAGISRDIDDIVVLDRCEGLFRLGGFMPLQYPVHMSAISAHGTV